LLEIEVREIEISKVSPSPGQVVENGQSANVQNAQENSTAVGSSQVAQKDFQVNLQDIIQNKLADLTNLLQNRAGLIQSLPADIQKLVQQLLQQMSSAKDIAQGMEYSLTAQKNIAEQLNNLVNILEIVATLQKSEYPDVQILLQQITESLTGQADSSPDQLADQLLQLAKQLNTVSQSNLKQAIEQLLQEFSSENAQQQPSNADISQRDLKQAAVQLLQQFMPENIDENGRQAVAQLAKLLEKSMPLALQQSSEQNGITDLPEAWSVLTAVDAQQFKDVSPKVLQQAAAALQELYQEMKTSPDKAAVAAKLELFVQTLSPEIGKAVQQAIKQGISDDTVLALIKTFENAAQVNEKIPEDAKVFLAKLAENGTAKSLAAPAADLLAQAVNQLSETASTIEQIKTLMKDIHNQLFSANAKLFEKAQPNLDQLTKLVEQNIPQALQDLAGKIKSPELLKMWVLLKAAGGEPWLNSDPQNLQKSVATIKELAQSMYKSLAGETERQIDHKTLSFTVPLYFADGTSYPTHIHIYQQEKENGNQVTKKQFETWMRVSVDTQNIGLVDSVFRLYEENKLDLRVIFPDSDAISEFTKSLPEIRKSIEDTTLTLTNIMINKI
jgi:phage gpG-like protein